MCLDQWLLSGPSPFLNAFVLLYMSLCSLCSALLYLNGDFEGGEFFYAHSTKDLSPDVSY